MSMLQALIAIIVLTFSSWLHAEEDGVYVGSKATSQIIRLKIINGSIRSQSNANDRFRLAFSFDPKGRASGSIYRLVLDGQEKWLSRLGSNESGTIFGLDNLTHEEASKASKFFALPLESRQHPGHRIDAVFTTDKAVYAPGETVVVTMTLKNLGEKPIYFMKGSTDSELSFSPVSVPAGTEVKPPPGVIIASSAIYELPPHGESTISAHLTARFGTEIPGHYYFFGTFILVMFKDQRPEALMSAEWIDYATRPLQFEVKEGK